MHVGYSAVFQNPEDHLTDSEVDRRTLRRCELAGPRVFSDSGRPGAEAERNVRLFAARVPPELKKEAAPHLELALTA